MDRVKPHSETAIPTKAASTMEKEMYWIIIILQKNVPNMKELEKRRGL